MVNESMTKVAKIHNGVKTVSSKSGVEESGQIHKKYETGTLSYTIPKNKLRID